MGWRGVTNDRTSKQQVARCVVYGRHRLRMDQFRASVFWVFVVYTDWQQLKRKLKLSCVENCML